MKTLATVYIRLAQEGLWTNNPGFVQLLGLCPLLAVSNTVVNGLGLGIATTISLIVSNFMISMIRSWVPPEIRLPIFVLIIAAIVTTIELLMNAYWHELYLALGIFIPLIVTNCIVIGRAEAYASKNPPSRAAFDGLMMGTGFSLVLVLLASVRELIGKGTLFDQASLLFGQGSEWLTLVVFESYRGFLIAILPPGAFIGLGLLLALKNVLIASGQNINTKKYGDSDHRQTQIIISNQVERFRV